MGELSRLVGSSVVVIGFDANLPCSAVSARGGAESFLSLYLEHLGCVCHRSMLNTAILRPGCSLESHEKHLKNTNHFVRGVNV